MDRGDPVRGYRAAERRLREVFLGDGAYTAGLVRRDEPRRRVLRELRLMREAFDVTVADAVEDRAERAEAKVADLEKELRRIAAARSRREREPEGGRPGSGDRT